MFDFSTFQEQIFPDWAAQFKVGQGVGEYSFNKGGRVDSYGSADMFIMRYALDGLENLDDGIRDAWAATINSFQDPTTGKFRKTYTPHFWEHTTAYCTAALKLADRAPVHPMAWKDRIIKDEKSMEAWTKQWHVAPWSLIWSGSHVWSGVPAALAMTGEGTEAFFNWYFKWFDAHVDPRSGFWRRGWLHRLAGNKVTGNDMFGAFHMYYVYEYLGKQWPLPEKVVDWTLKLQLENGLWGKSPAPYCRDLDGIYCLTRSSRNAGGYRADDVRAAVEKFLVTAEKRLNDREFVFSHYTNTHYLSGAPVAIAECQKFYPDLVSTPKPWPVSLDKACYI
jgi:hypothetical protein